MDPTDYLLSLADSDPPQEPYPATFTDSRITPLVDCSNFAAELTSALALVGTGADATANAGHFIYIANWRLGLVGGEYTRTTTTIGSLSNPGPDVTENVDYPPFHLDAAGGSNTMLDVLHAKAAAGVDVRVLGWISFGIMSYAFLQQAGDSGLMASLNGLTMKSIKDLRSDPRIGANAVLNLIGHTAASVHTKLVVIGTPAQAIGFTGGIDLQEDYWGHPGHDTPASYGDDSWHDVVAKVEGPAVQALYDLFKNMYNENLSRPAKSFQFQGMAMPSFLPDSTPVPAKVVPVPATPAGKMRVQSLRTVPMFNYAWSNCLPENPPISFGDDSASKGIFEFMAAMRHAISQATTYIYIEDQYFWSYDVMSWINQALNKQQGLYVILVTSGKADPNDPEFPDSFVCNAINHGLLTGLTPAQIARVGFFRRMQSFSDKNPYTVTATKPDAVANRTQAVTSAMTVRDVEANHYAGHNLYLRGGGNLFPVVGNLPAPDGTDLTLIVGDLPGPTPIAAGSYILTQASGITMHAKTAIIDDVWTCIGSANCIRRSLFTDLEHSVAYVDLDNVVAQQYRTSLWADHFRHQPASDFNDIQEALWSWNSAWGRQGAAPPRPPELIQTTIPITPDVPLQGNEKSKYDWYEDVNSQDPWGGLCPFIP